MGPLESLDTRLLVDLLMDRIEPRKSLGQHYLIDDEVIERTMQISAEQGSPISENSHVLEVGPGPGSLTLAMLKRSARITAIEIDEKSVNHLIRVFRDKECNLEIIQGDALSIGWPEGITHMISNIPYQISSPILDRLTKLHSSVPIDQSILLVQDDFAQRMAMTSAPYDIGPLGLNLWLDFEVEIDKKVAPHSFTPSPRVNSRLVILRPVKRPEVEGINKQLFRILTKHCFSNRRRKISTLLKKPPSRISRVSGWHRERWESSTSKLIQSGIPELEEGWYNLRPENLEPEDWVSIVRNISS